MSLQQMPSRVLASDTPHVNRATSPYSSNLATLGALHTPAGYRGRHDFGNALFGASVAGVLATTAVVSSQPGIGFEAAVSSLGCMKELMPMIRAHLSPKLPNPLGVFAKAARLIRASLC